nr:MAG TPA: hypothetical protein [Caudoviricetes sp.]
MTLTLKCWSVDGSSHWGSIPQYALNFFKKVLKPLDIKRNICYNTYIIK